MRKSHSVWIHGLLLLVVAIVLVLVVQVRLRPMHAIIQESALIQSDVEVLQVSSHEQGVVALISVNENQLGLARLHKEGLTFVVDEVYDNQSAQRNDHMELLLAQMNERYYVVIRQLLDEVDGLMLVFSPIKTNVIGHEVNSLCVTLQCTKQIGIGINPAWYMFESSTLEELTLLAYEDGVVVSYLTP